LRSHDENQLLFLNHNRLPGINASVIIEA
jgi:hypothetical protein